MPMGKKFEVPSNGQGGYHFFPGILQPGVSVTQNTELGINNDRDHHRKGKRSPNIKEE